MTNLTDHNREVAYEMFAKDETSEKIARRIRKSVGSVRALRANWTRSLTAPSTSTSTVKTSRPKAVAQSVKPLTINVSREKLQEALKNGQPVQLVIK